MANEDEKVLIVPPFGRKDIQEIAKEGDEADSYDEVVALVDKAIQKGDLPSGMKLYRHEIKDGNTLLCVIISPKKDAYEFSDLHDSRFGIMMTDEEMYDVVNIALEGKSVGPVLYQYVFALISVYTGTKGIEKVQISTNRGVTPNEVSLYTETNILVYSGAHTDTVTEL